MKLKYYTLFFGLFLLYNSILIAQDIHFSQAQQMPILSNPAFTGSFGGEFRLTSIYRSQWTKLSAPYRTFAVAADTKYQTLQASNFLGIGLLVASDKAGELGFHTTGFQLAMAYQMYLGKIASRKGDFYIRFGLRGGETVQGFDRSALRLEDASVDLPMSDQLRHFDFSLGLLGVYAEPDFFLYWGGSLSNPHQPFTSFLADGISKSPWDIGKFLAQKFTLQGGADIAIRSNQMALLPDFYYSQQGSYRECISSLAVRFHRFSLAGQSFGSKVAWEMGIAYRWGDAMILTNKWHIDQTMSLAFSYDFSLSNIGQANRRYGALEFSMVYTFQSSRTTAAPSHSGGLRKMKRRSGRPTNAFYQNETYRIRGLAR